jgi:hypothetical protein
VWFKLTTSIWKRNRIFLCRPLLVAKYRPVKPVPKQMYISRASIVVFLKITSVQFYLKRWSSKDTEIYSKSFEPLSRKLQFCIFAAKLKGSRFFFSWTVRIHCSQTYDGYTCKYQTWIKYLQSSGARRRIYIYIVVLPSLRRYSSGWALTSWTICLHSSLFRGWLSGFWTILFLWCEVVSSRPTPNLENQGITLHLAHTPWPVRHGWLYQ